MTDPDHIRLVEALLFASHQPLDERTLADNLPPGTDVAAILVDLQQDYASRGVNLVCRGGKWAFRTADDLAGRLAVEQVQARRLSRAAIEVLAIIAYNQPITRAEIEEVRGVALSKGTLDLLFEAGWIRPRGRRRSPGKPLLWGTSDGFLDQFGLESLDDLPSLKELKAAGLLDARPAADAYGNRAVDGLIPVDTDEDEVEPELDLLDGEDDDEVLGLAE
ncbi:SMC-Scp complex subunit ScpB [Magnetospirillum moscoviense]|uniref:SMC-Scp complex subunit ScpB n=1 Tax=Magnetospirillum moscoviense TaxID=1437059 RepID=A0A178MJE1_9PROT|nr:SMC-Scp complex subunit ScpB [Magnetospirillum moscoviense]MBF0323668.1 SMC-Scp complex subunit ScpB [Alphaproteobacteria bacterium]OAN48852.1 SMC-Scp complex subunit ScpB [Magnetospirillum moscoviense]